MDADGLLRWCIYLYMQKRGWQLSAETFRKECGISEDDVGIDHSIVDTMWSSFHGMCAAYAVIIPNPSKAPVQEIIAKENTLHVGSPRIVQSTQRFEASTSYGNMTLPPNIRSLEGISLQEVSFGLSPRPVLVCDFSSDGRFLVGANSDDGTEDWDKVLIWNTQTWALVSIPNAHEFFIYEVRFKADSTIFASSCLNAIKIWDAANISGSYEPSAVLEGATPMMYSSDFHPTEDIIWSCNDSNMIHVWNVNDKSVIRTFSGGRRKVRFQPPMGKLVAAGSGREMNIFDADSSHVVSTLRTLELWIPETGEMLPIRAHQQKVVGLAASLVKGWIASASAAGECLRIWK